MNYCFRWYFERNRQLLFTLLSMGLICIGTAILVIKYWNTSLLVGKELMLSANWVPGLSPRNSNSASPHNPTIVRLSQGIEGGLQDPTPVLLCIHPDCWCLGHPHYLIILNITLTFWLFINHYCLSSVCVLPTRISNGSNSLAIAYLCRTKIQSFIIFWINQNTIIL